MRNLKNKVALITGGTSGIGLATAEEFINEGLKVIITGRSQNTIDETVRKLGSNTYGVVSDAGKMQDLHVLAAQVQAISPKIDILFINAGYGKFASVEMVDEALFNELFNVLVKGTFFTAQQLLPMINEGGSIIFNTSFVTEFGFQNFSIYSAAKSAVQSFIKTLAAECTSRKIRVNGISPGHIMTDIFNKTGLSPEQIKDVTESIIPTIPLARFGRPSEIARTVSFLASDDASYIHATEIRVDGGLSKIW